MRHWGLAYDWILLVWIPTMSTVRFFLLFFFHFYPGLLLQAWGQYFWLMGVPILNIKTEYHSFIKSQYLLCQSFYLPVESIWAKQALAFCWAVNYFSCVVCCHTCKPSQLYKGNLLSQQLSLLTRDKQCEKDWNIWSFLAALSSWCMARTEVNNAISHIIILYVASLGCPSVCACVCVCDSSDMVENIV